MGFVNHIGSSFRMLTFDRQAIEDVSEEQNGNIYGFTVMMIAGVASATSLDFTRMALQMGSLLLIFALGLLFYYLIGKKLLEEKATGTQYFRYLSNTAVIYWFTFIPAVGIPLQIFAASWMMILNTYILTHVHGISSWKAIVSAGLLPFCFLSVSVIINSTHIIF